MMEKSRKDLRPLPQKRWNFKLLAWILVLALLAPPLNGFSVHASEEALPETEASPTVEETLPETTEASTTAQETLPETTEALPAAQETLPETTEALSAAQGTLTETTEALPTAQETLPETQEALPESEHLCVHHPEHTQECGYDASAGGQPCGFVCSLCVTDWSWNDDEGMLVPVNETLWGLGLPGASKENPVTEEILDEFLPQSITARTAAGEQAVALTWDYSAFTGPAYAGEYMLTAVMEGEYVLTEDAPALEVLVDLGGGETYDYGGVQGPKFLNNWYFISLDGSEMTKNELVVLVPELNSKSTDKIILDLKTNVLPVYLGGWVVNDTDPINDPRLTVLGWKNINKSDAFSYITNDAEYATYPTGQAQWGQYQIDGWENFPASFKSGESYTIRAITTVHYDNNNRTYRLFVNSNNPEDYKKNQQDTSTNPDILNLTITLYDLGSTLTSHTVPAANPENVTVNLFDYWVKTQTPSAPQGDILDKNDWHYRMDSPPLGSSPVAFSTERDWNLGINQGHLLLFGDGMIHAGLWNKGAGESCDYGKKYAGMEGIVKNVLPGNGYPELNLAMAKKILTDGTPERNVEWVGDWKLTGDHIPPVQNNVYDSSNIQNLSNTVIGTWDGNDISTDTESLQYLFDPSSQYDNATNPANCRTSYTNVTGLFQLDENGYYYYDMRENFAEFRQDINPDGSENNHFILYDAPATIRTDAAQSIGNFFPFNKGSEVFTGIDPDKKTLTSSVNCFGNTMNHHLGMTINVDFRQPANGFIHTGTARQPMTFEFAGDDDVWVFIDDVLVLDLGGIHSEIYGTIDFSTGDIYIGRAFDSRGIPDDPENPDHMVTHTTLLDAYKAAGREDTTSWNGNTFASNTSHTLRMFYLERGNYDSSIALRFNLQPLLYQQIEKVDQNGQPLPGVKFTLHPAEVTTDTSAIRCLYTDDGERGQTFYVRPDYSEDLVTLQTEANGSAVFQMPDGSYFNFADRGEQYYVLSETTTPNGYRTQPVDIVLHYDPATSMLSVANRWTTGAYACSVAHLTAVGQLRYGQQSGTIIQPGSEIISDTVQENGLVVAIPMLRKTSDQSWLALHGSNMGGFYSTPIQGSTDDIYRSDLLRAALEQAASDGASAWHLKWDKGNSRLYGTLNDLPGLASRYQFNDPNGDMNIVYGIISPDALQALGLPTGDADTCYAALRQYLEAHTVDDALSAILNVSGGFRLLSTNQFSQDFRSLIYIPNERRELQVLKVDQDGVPLAGARFGLYDNPDCSGAPNASGYTDSDGMLIFSPTGNSSVAGQARMVWANSADNSRYYLKEISAPAGYALNPTITPVVVGAYSIYADAGASGDGVSVMASVGRLTQTMRQFALDGDVDTTLRDITAFMQTQPSGQFQMNGWQDSLLEGTNVNRSMNLHFGKNTDMDYGLHDEDGGRIYSPFFVTDTGFIRARIQQNYAALTGSQYEGARSDANKEDLGSIDLTNLFSLLNIVVVTDWTGPLDQTGQLTVGKLLPDGGLPDSDYTKNFTFTLRLQNPDGSPLTGSYYFYGDDKAGYIASGQELILHHDERITILGLPAGTRYTVTEKPENDWRPIPNSGTFSGQITGNKAASAVFTNTKQPHAPSDPGSGSGSGSGSDSSARGLSNPPLTGDASRPGLWMLCASLSLSALIALGFALNKRKDMLSRDM